jgi:indolepyruvate ferredoxin oxidoreductase beta subunit
LKRNRPTNILICGVGGQGILLASEVLALAAIEDGWDVKKSEVHGMAQRGGSVVSHIRFGEQVFSPLIPQGEADFLLSFEEMETLRWMHYLRKGGLTLVNLQRIVPLSLSARGESYPEDIRERIRARGKAVFFDGLKIARKVGHLRTVNIALLGSLSPYLTLSLESWRRAIQARIPAKALEVNLDAFQAGRVLAQDLGKEAQVPTP